MFLLYYLYAAKGWGLHDLKALYEGRDGWQKIIREFAAFQEEQRRQKYAW